MQSNVTNDSAGILCRGQFRNNYHACFPNQQYSCSVPNPCHLQRTYIKVHFHFRQRHRFMLWEGTVKVPCCRCMFFIKIRMIPFCSNRVPQNSDSCNGLSARAAAHKKSASPSGLTLSLLNLNILSLIFQKRQYFCSAFFFPSVLTEVYPDRLT